MASSLLCSKHYFSFMEYSPYTNRVGSLYGLHPNIFIQHIFTWRGKDHISLLRESYHLYSRCLKENLKNRPWGTPWVSQERPIPIPHLLSIQRRKWYQHINPVRVVARRTLLRLVTRQYPSCQYLFINLVRSGSRLQWCTNSIINLAWEAARRTLPRLGPRHHQLKCTKLDRDN